MTDRTTEWARKVVAGKIIVGELVRLAAERHLRDLKDGKKRGLSWDVAAAERAIDFFPSVLSITEGAKVGEPFNLLPWHLFVVGSIYGWKDANGLRRFRFVWMETGKGQAKSPLMAGLGLYEIIGRKKRRAEVYCIGEDRKTANVMFRDAVAMCRAPIPDEGEDTLETTQRVMIRGTGDNAWRIEHPSSGSKFEPVANSDAISGPKPVLVLGDEIHEMKSNKAISVWRAAIAKMSGDPMMVLGTNTPSVDQQVGTEYSEYFQRVLRGENTDDSAFAFIARTDKGDDPFHDESCWVKSLPALGITYPIDNVRKEVQTSRNMISTALTTKRLYFGIPVGTAGFWIAEDAWEGTQGEIDEAEMVGRRLHLSLDLSEKNDLTALSGCWEGERLAVKTWYFTTEERLDERSTADQIPYREIEATGQLTITKSATIDYSYVVQRVQKLCADHDVEQLVVDSTFIQNFMRAAEEAGFACWMYDGDERSSGVGLKIVRHAQGGKVVFEEKMLCMPLSMRHLEDKILKGELVIDRNRLTTICASNAVVQSDAFKNKYFHKNRSRGRIDGMVTIAMAVGSAASQMDARSRSYLEDEDLIVL
ncbi:terminase large subunit [Falsirhodobacter halotolerans]|uniref:terminase large subunit n=1 Tax=Falsirhodobacter halotolerans TaxID=1146892 RepID=UPI001FD06C32|nr:terminase TerL endonuclease subunit [Falsirhodobacter halotolerans]MCJ8138596.1 terminase large subunit [Falsirhodobacter halotolerans]